MLHAGFQSLQVCAEAKDTDSDRKAAIQIRSGKKHLCGSVDLGQELLVQLVERLAGYSRWLQSKGQDRKRWLGDDFQVRNALQLLSGPLYQVQFFIEVVLEGVKTMDFQR